MQVLIKPVVILFLGMACYSHGAQARWATFEDVDFKFEKTNRFLQVHRDGTYEETVEIQAKVLKESGKDKLISLSIPYNASNTRFKILEAKTILKGVDYPVDQKNIEDKPLASNVKGFDQRNQVLIAFPKIQLNASIYLKFQRQLKEPPLKGFFDYHLPYGLNGYEEAGTFQVASEIPLHVVVHDQQKALETVQSEKSGKFLLSAVLKKPVLFDVLDEPHTVLDPRLGTWIRISTLKNWPDFGQQIASSFEAVIHQPLPHYFEPILKVAKQKKTVHDQLNTVTARLAESLSYMGDWRSIKGAYVPRNLQVVADTRFGDCKDFSALTVALLRQLGFEAYPALVNRGFGVYHEILDLPGFNNFNHAIVYVKTKKGNYWIDPTNFTSFAPHIYPDIADRASLILFPEDPQMVHIPLPLAIDSKAMVIEQVTIDEKGNKGQIAVNGHLRLSGWHALAFTGADLMDAKETTNRNIIRAVTDVNRALQWHVDEYSLRSRIVKPLDFSFSYTAVNSTIRSSVGKAYFLRENALSAQFLFNPKQRVSDLYLGRPATYYHEMTLTGVKKVGNRSLNCAVKSPWFSGERVIQDTQMGLKIMDHYRLLKPLILNVALHTKAYQDFQSEIYHCFADMALIYENDR